MMISIVLHQLLTDRFGAFTLERLGGLSGRATYKVASQAGAALLKTNACENEVWFYQHRAPSLRGAGIGIPNLEMWGESDGQRWLLLEWIPAALPEERWLADREVLKLLGRLHQFQMFRDWTSAFQPQWTLEMTAQFLERLSSERAAKVEDSLEILRFQCEPLFQPDHLISGDPNPLNWGVRADGSVVLFDWERCTSASPLLDLAITIPGLGSPKDFQRVMKTYSELTGFETSDEVVQRVVAAKAWTVVELLFGLRADQHATLVDYLVTALPDWLETVVR